MFYKNYFSFLLVFVFASIGFAQKGSTKIGNYEPGTSFLLKEGNNVWIGKGGWTASYTRRNLGLVKYENNVKKELFNSGVFTDAVSFNNKVFVSSYDGLYSFDANNNSSLYDSLKLQTCIKVHNDSLIIGTAGNGFAMFKNGHFRFQKIQIGSLVIDTIFSVLPNNNMIYFGTSRGLVKYENNAFSLVYTPIIDTKVYFTNFMQKSILSLQIDVYGKLWYAIKNPTNFSNVYLMEGNESYRIDSLFNNRLCLNASFWPKYISKIELNNDGHVILNAGWGIIEFGNTIQTFPLSSALKDPNMQNSLNDFSNNNIFATKSDNSNLVYCLFDGVFEFDPQNYDVNQFFNEIRQPYINSLENIDINDLNASVSSDGLLYGVNDILRFFTNSPGLRIKSGPCANASFSGGVWMGGVSKSDSKVYFSQQSYRSNGSDFVPGPINTNTLMYDSVLSNQFNQLWKVDKQTIDDFIANHNNPGYQIPLSILNWPGNAPANCYSKMAPYVDVDNNNVYEPIKGDYPKIKGDMMIWWTFNDLVAHTATNAEPLMIQINASCYAYSDIRLNAMDSNYIVNRTLLFDYDVINLGNRDFKDVYFSVFNDVDIGNYADDFLGYDSLNNAAFAFNGDSEDEAFGNFNNFGKNPPVFVSQFLNKKMDRFVRLNVPGINNSAESIYNTMQAKSDSSNIDFFKSNAQFHHYPCQMNDSAVNPTDIRFLMTNSVGDFNKMDVYNIQFSNFMVYDPNVNFLKQDCNKIKSDILKIKSWYDNDNFPSKSYWPTDLERIENKSFVLYPNPSSNVLNVQFPDDASRQYKILGLDGKLILDAFSNSSSELIDVKGFKPGIYVFQVLDANGLSNQIFVIN